MSKKNQKKSAKIRIGTILVRMRTKASGFVTNSWFHIIQLAFHMLIFSVGFNCLSLCWDTFVIYWSSSVKYRFLIGYITAKRELYELMTKKSCNINYQGRRRTMKGYLSRRITKKNRNNVHVLYLSFRKAPSERHELISVLLMPW